MSQNSNVFFQQNIYKILIKVQDKVIMYTMNILYLVLA